MANQQNPLNDLKSQPPKNIAAMSPVELHEYILSEDKAHNTRQRRLKALLRCMDGGAELLDKKAGA